MNVGVESPVRTKTVALRSHTLRGRRAARMPTLSPRMSQMMPAPTAREMSTWTHWPRSVVTGSCSLYDSPRLPESSRPR